jgi:3-polyprenyl-4-hydroxybenzoate decarboxylase
VTDEDKARAAQRLLDEPMLAEALALVEHDYIEAMLKADGDVALREGRDTVKAIRAIPVKLKHAIAKVQERNRTRPHVA